MLVKVLIINGPNLNLIGERKKEVYGDVNLDEYLSSLKGDFDVFYTNLEGEIINQLQQAEKKVTRE